MNCRILFVDDEPNVLHGLRRMLFPLRDKWEMRFAGSGCEALELLEKERFDVVVSDLKMPGMDGVQLLNEVRIKHPNIARIILSGYSDKSRLYRSARTAHQFLSKPSTPEQIRSTVEHVLALKDIFLDNNVREVVSSLESLPVLAHTYDKLLNLAESERVSLQEVGALVAVDIGLAATLLKLVNSSFFGLPQKVVDPGRAVALLGIEVLKALILTEELFSAFDDKQFPEFRLEGLWVHSRNTALFVRAISRMEKLDKETSEQAFMAGTLHDVGKLILASAFPDKYREIIALTADNSMPIVEAERQVMGISHAEMGAYLLGLWGFEEQVVRAVACHHSPESCQKAKVSALLHAANSLEHELVVFNREYAPHPVNEALLAQAGFEDRFDGWRDECARLEDSAQEVDA